jgi:hypothetical protein
MEIVMFVKDLAPPHIVTFPTLSLYPSFSPDLNEARLVGCICIYASYMHSPS